jgi:lambda family phage tail tape measure protein
MSNNIARLGVVMGLDTAEFTSGLGKVEKQLDSFKDRLMEFASVAAFVEMTKKAMEYADTIATTAKANDVTTASVLELSKALEENGGNAEETGRIFSGFNQKVETAALGSAKAQESFARLGVSLNDIKTLSSQDLFEKTITGLAKIQDSVTRNGIAFQTLGRGIRGVDLVGLAQTLEESKGAFDRYAEAVNMAHELHLKIEASGRKITLMFTEAVIPTLLVVYNEFTKAGGALDYVFSGLKYLTVGFAIWAEAAVVAVKYVIDVIKMLAYTVNDLLTLSIDKAIEHFKSGLTEIKKDGSDYIEFLQKLKKANTESSGGGVANDAANRDVINANAKKLGLAQQLTAEYKKQQDLQLQMVIQQRDLLTLTNDQKIVQQAINKVIDENQKAVNAIDKQIAAARGTQGGSALIKVYEQQKEAILKLKQTYIDSTKEEVQATIDFQRTFEFGWNHAWNQFKEDAGNNAKIAEGIFNSVMGSMNSAIDTFVTTGKMSFADLARSVLQDLEKMILKALLWKAISSASGMFGGGGGTSGFMNDMGYMELAGSLAFANGGDPPVGVPSMVGENGPELFVPRQSGTIIPNNKLSGMGGTTNVTNNYIQAIDTKSFEERLYGSNKAIWAANQYADKNLSTSRSRT